MDKKLLINGGLLAAAILAAGYVYSDKIANTLGIGHKPDVQVEESVDKKEDKTASKITEVKNEPVQSSMNDGPSLTINPTQLKNEFLTMRVKSKNSARTYELRDVFSATSRNWKIDCRPDGTIVADFDNSEVVAEFKKINGHFDCVRIKNPAYNVFKEGSDADRYWADGFDKMVDRIDYNMSR